MEKKDRGFSLKIHTLTSNPNGPRTVEKTGWIGRLFICPRSNYAEHKDRKELQKPGVYILIGEESDFPIIYIGEGEKLIDRINSHNREKDFWQFFISITSSDEFLNKAIIRYIEKELIKYSIRAKKAKIDNGQGINPDDDSSRTLSEADIDDTETFIEQIILCLSVLGLDFFSTPIKKEKKQIEFLMKIEDIEATGYEDGPFFVIKKGSQIRANTLPSLPPYARTFRDNLLGIPNLFEKKDLYYVLKEDHQFSSPSNAAIFVAGRPTNGLLSWIEKSSKMNLKEYRAQLSD